MSDIRPADYGGKRILNVGCGSDPYGTDRLDKYSTPVTTEVWDVERGLPYAPESFDEIYSKNLLEHLRNVGDHLHDCYQALKHNGKLIIVTDNAGCLKYYLLGTHTGGYENSHSDRPEDRHYSVFTMHHLENHLRHVGFELREMKYCGTDYWTKRFDALVGKFMPELAYARIRVEVIKP